MNYAFLDESGTVGVGLVMTGAVISTSYVNRRISRIIKDVMRGQNSLSIEIPRTQPPRASDSRPEITHDIIRRLGKENLPIYVRVLNEPLPQQADPNRIYDRLVAVTVADCIDRHGDLHAVLHNYYDNPDLAKQLEETVRNEVANRGAGRLLSLTQTDLIDRRWGYQLVAIDNVVWAVHRSLNYGETDLYGIISQRIAQGGQRDVTIEELTGELLDDET